MGNNSNLFPARARFTNQDGTLTSEAFRAVNGVSGDVKNVVTNTTNNTTVINQIKETVIQQNVDLTEVKTDITALKAKDASLDSRVTALETAKTDFADFFSIMQPMSSELVDDFSIYQI